MFFLMQYKRIVWGLIIVLLDLRIGFADIFPDFIGYLIITMGLSELGEQNEYYEKAKKFSQLLILLSIPGIYKHTNSLISFPSSYENAVVAYVLLSAYILKLFMVYYICRAAMKLCLGNRLYNLFKVSKLLCWLYLSINGSIAIIVSLNMSIKKAQYIPLSGLTIAWAIMEMLLIIFVYIAGQKLSGLD